MTYDIPKSARLEKHYKSPRGKISKAKHKSTKTFLTVSDGSDSSQENTKRIRSASYAGDKRPRRSLLSRRHGTGQRLSSSEETLALKKSSTFHEMHTDEDKVSLVYLSRYYCGRFPTSSCLHLSLFFLSVSTFICIYWTLKMSITLKCRYFLSRCFTGLSGQQTPCFHN